MTIKFSLSDRNRLSWREDLRVRRLRSIDRHRFVQQDLTRFGPDEPDFSVDRTRFLCFFSTRIERRNKIKLHYPFARRTRSSRVSLTQSSVRFPLVETCRPMRTRRVSIDKRTLLGRMSTQRRVLLNFRIEKAKDLRRRPFGQSDSSNGVLDRSSMTTDRSWRKNDEMTLIPMGEEEGNAANELNFNEIRIPSKLKISRDVEPRKLVEFDCRVIREEQTVVSAIFR